MKVVHLCYYYGHNTSGAPIAAMRLHQALLRCGVESHYICVEQRDSGRNVHVLPASTFVNRLFYLVVRAFWVLSKFVTGKMVMPNIFPLVGFKKKIKEIDPDVIHVQYVGQDMMSFHQLTDSRRPMVFTLHDLGIANAIEAHPQEDLRFFDGFTSKNSTGVERWMFARKRRFISSTAMIFTGPSDWVCGMFSRSFIGRGRPVYKLLNCVDPVYAYDPALRRPHEKFTVLFGAYGGRNAKYKGWTDLAESLSFLPAAMRGDMRIVIFGESAKSQILNGVELVFKGAIRDPHVIRRLHHEADVLALPSRYDNAPQVKFEALMDGLPVLAFNRTGCPEGISHKENGWVSPDGDCEDYAKGLRYFYTLFKTGDLFSRHRGIAAAAAEAFSEASIVQEACAIYRTAVKKASNCCAISRQV
jgi:glycosyltransferase involved in cell wall biosynthesis